MYPRGHVNVLPFRFIGGSTSSFVTITALRQSLTLIFLDVVPRSLSFIGSRGRDVYGNKESEHAP